MYLNELKIEYGRTEREISEFTIIRSGKPTEDENNGH